MKIKIGIFIFLIFISSLSFCQYVETYNIITRDGVSLSTDIYFPFYSSSPLPVILIRTCYGKENLSSIGFYFSSKKYIVAIQDTRGHGKSGGKPSSFLKEADDGFDTIKWLEEKNWCNKNIGCFGASALGINNYLLSSTNVSSLKTIVSLVATPDLYEYAVYPGGVFREYDILKWMEDNGEGENIPLILENPARNFLWDFLSLDGKYDNLNISTLNIGGWYDLFKDGTIEAYRGFKKISKNKEDSVLIMGPWTHSGYTTTKQGELNYPTNSILNLDEIIEKWFDYYLKGKGEKPFKGKSFFGYLMGDVKIPSNDYNVWINLEEYNQINYPLKRFYFSKENKLIKEKPKDENFQEIKFNPEEPSPTIGGANLFLKSGPYDQRELLEKNDIIYFKTNFLEDPLKVLGNVYAEVFLSSDKKDLDVCIRLVDIYPDGKWMLLSDGCQRSRFRESFEEEKFFEEGKIYKIKINVGNIFYWFKEGHSIGLILSGSNYPRFEVNPQSGEEIHKETRKETANVKIYFSKKHPSRIVFPTFHEESHKKSF
jgi:predicted acyl esterase